MDACISVIENILQKQVGHDGAVATYAEYYLDIETHKPCFKLISIAIDGLTLRRYGIIDRNKMGAFIKNEGWSYIDHFKGGPTRYQLNDEISIALNRLTTNPNTKYWLICKDESIIGVIQEFETIKLGAPDETDLRLSPYMSVYQRGTRVMKKAYCALAAALNDIEGRSLSWGVTDVDNTPMQKIFAAAGLRRISESPVCPTSRGNEAPLRVVYALV